MNEEEQEEIDEAMEKMKLTLPIIAKVKQNHKGVTWVGVEKCPICKGKLHLRHSGYNGHVWGRCETENCLRWAE